MVGVRGFEPPALARNGGSSLTETISSVGQMPGTDCPGQPKAIAAVEFALGSSLPAVDSVLGLRFRPKADTRNPLAEGVKPAICRKQCPIPSRVITSDPALQLDLGK